MKKSVVAVVASIMMGFVGLVVGIFIDEIFGGASFEVAPQLPIIFTILTMGAFIIYYNDIKK